MRLLRALPLVFAVAHPVAAEEPASPLVQAQIWLTHEDAAVWQRAIDILVRRAEAGSLVEGERVTASDEIRQRRRGALALILAAKRLGAAQQGSTQRFLALEEVLRSPWAAHVDALLERAGLSATEAARLLAERAAARAAYETYLEQAWASFNDPTVAVATATKVGSALVPHLLESLSVSPWLAHQGWPPGPSVMRQRMSVWALKALRTREAVPYLLLHVDAPSATLQWDAWDALQSLTGDKAWAPDQGTLSVEVARTQRARWWAREGAAHAAAARWLALDALRSASDYLVALRADPQHRSPVGSDGAPDPLVELFAVLHLLCALPTADLPASQASLADLDAPAWMARIGSALRQLEVAP